MKRFRLFLLVSLLSLSVTSARSAEPAATFSIVAYDPQSKEWGIAVASRVLAVGSIVPWAKADVGAIATPEFANVTFGPKGLELLAAGKSAEEALKTLIEADSGRDQRQVGVVDSQGNAAHFTGSKCMAWAGAKSGKNFTCQGNLLTGPDVVEKMAEAYEKTEGRLVWKLMAALEAGEKAGGDKRGKQSAAILIVRDKGGYAGMNDRMLDLRVDDHETPVQELNRLVSKRFRRPEPKKE